MDLMQRQREQAAESRAQDAARAAHSRLKANGREASTEYGRALFRQHGEALALHLDQLMTRFVVTPTIAGPHYCALPLLLHFSGKGVRPVAAVALLTFLQTISQRKTYRRLSGAIGRAVEDEVRAGRVQRHNDDVLRLLRRHEGRRSVVSAGTARALGLQAEQWTTTDRAEVGGLLLDAVIASTGLARLVQQKVRGRAAVMVEPTEAALAWVQSEQAAAQWARQLPMLVPPRPWTGLAGGGYLESNRALVARRDGVRLDYLQGIDLGRALRAVNRVQQQQLVVDPWMAQLQMEAWQANIRGLFEVERDPAQPPDQPERGSNAEAWARWHQQKRQAWSEARTGRPGRVRVIDTLTAAADIAGQPMWQPHNLDHRGRLYTMNRVLSHQGPDHQKALIQFGRGRLCNDTAAAWMLKAAAGHWGLSRESWATRLQWGRDNVQRLVAVAEAPLDRLELWRDASDPWQFLQLARAFADWLADPATLIGVPVRLDQTTSGLGIAAALVRDRRTARLTNLIGSTRRDLYELVAEHAVARLQYDLENGTAAQRHQAALWLEVGITRALVKVPVMSSIYGAQRLSVVDQLAERLIAAAPPRGAGDYERRIAWPASYMAKRLQEVLKPQLAPCLALQKWLTGVSRAVVTQGRPVRWTSPLGFPIQLGATLGAAEPAKTLLHGGRGWLTEDSERRRVELSARATNRSITPNLVHSFDAALAQQLICSAEDVGAEVLTNHDCFATSPADADWLHTRLHNELRELYRTDWLPEIRNEIACLSGVKTLAAAPVVGTLCAGEIGQNPYCFS